ncbi:hypothetical protein GUITHDRAFT_147763 [Guillardia theta CCMP2712]|uniref:Uncharacterized protein n=1 Tax=Guillardia theta (strain CCMP2712) TaxID=905079 RepID=L1ICH8_GUITC|nr:hypothetical protein GUITHDRAFT_147763 [Guillardia theta CCMP2712]EKX33634.1 hypothetical protein GUITHDRAFT_147763 [Guillardia theta CCMP2712]|eukprot:XP_005820614.1 hypothetical protein GUITHDRAFT_147763 [Guillardia theta CCMP2712]
MVGRARGGLRLPLQGAVQRGVTMQPTTAMAAQMQLRQGPRMAPTPDKISAPSSKDGDSVASGASTVCLTEDSKHPEIVRTGYILSLTAVILTVCVLESKGNVYALNLAILTALPLLSATAVLHSYSMNRLRLSVLAAVATTLSAWAAISILVNDNTLSLLRHIPGMALLNAFFYLMSTRWRRIISVVCSVLILLCIAMSAIIDATLPSKQVIVLLTILIFFLLFVQSNIAVTPGPCKKSDGCSLGMV